jgi:hypothetical protein
VKAKPELVLASALKPSAARARAEPASHGLGITNGSPLWSAWNAAPFCSWFVRAPDHMAAFGSFVKRPILLPSVSSHVANQPMLGMAVLS